LGDADLVHGLVYEPSAVVHDDKHRALFAFIDQVNTESYRVTAEDTARLREIGWTDEELYFVTTVVALFNFYNRWIDASGVHALSDDVHRAGGKRSAAHGYARE
jgi:alkylhydroperoxidase family enzyme